VLIGKPACVRPKKELLLFGRIFAVLSCRVIEFGREAMFVKRLCWAIAALAIVAIAPTAKSAETQAESMTAASSKVTRQVFGDWVVACVPQKSGHKSCIMLQTLASQKLKKPVSVFTIGKDRAGKLKGSLRVPVGVSLSEGVVVDVGKQAPFTVSYSACHPIGCFAAFDLTAPLIGNLKSAKQIAVIAHSVSQQALKFDFSTRGFPAAYERYVAQSK
jgi:invasion protein IalB